MDEQDIAIREFLAESYENLDQLERDLVTIEADPRNRDTLGALPHGAFDQRSLRVSCLP